MPRRLSLFVSSLCASPREQPPALFEDPVGARVELLRRLRDGQFAVDDVLGDDPYLVGNAFPLGHFRRRFDALELLAKRACINVIGKRTFAPRAASRWKVARQRMKAPLHGRLRQILEQLPPAALAPGF